KEFAFDKNIKFDGEVRRTIFQKGNFKIISVRPNINLYDPDGIEHSEVTVLGDNLPKSTDKIELTITGHWEFSRRYNTWQIKAHVATLKLDHGIDGVKAFFGSGLIKGVGPKTTEQIIKKFGADAFKVLEEEPKRYTEIRGITKRKLKAILESYKENIQFQNVLTELGDLGLSPNTIIRLYKEVPDLTQVIRENPFSLCHKGLNFGFMMADGVAQELGLDPWSEERYAAAIQFILIENEMNGHCYMPINELIDKVQKMALTESITERFSTEEQYDLIERSLFGHVPFGERMQSVEYFNAYEDEDGRLLIYRYWTRKAEKDLAKCLVQLNNQDSKSMNIQIDQRIKKEINKLDFHPAKEQLEAVKSFLQNAVTIMTGYPGTGKTTTLKLALDALGSNNVLLCSPTGKAARRMSEQTGRDAMTIHKVLYQYGIMSQSSVDHNARLPDIDAIVIDEASMLDLEIANILFKAISKGTRILIVGDPYQLPSIGAGNVLYDMIHSGVLPVITLDVVFRQNETSTVAENAARIRRAKSTLDYNESDFQFIQANTPNELHAQLVAVYKLVVEEVGQDEVICLSPFRRRNTGAEELNKLLRPIMNPIDEQTSPSITHKNVTFFPGDRVMQTKNVFLEIDGFETDLVNNGDIGTIVDIYKNIDESGRDHLVAVVEFNDQSFHLIEDDFKNLDHAYATTVHKSQGSEFHTVILCLQKSHYHMLRRNLVYTGITRASKRVIIIGQKQAVAIGISKDDTAIRNTLLDNELQFADKMA
ncbi:MAG TPA: AAA family ATPase, partial [Clostridiaceae bacterium]|nr:AAA family ATPase [Clostridiaceae bacterium]